tara:strand:- start:73 stop:408 length:336 start_codon:yes stop_codon:yes gene_type:complete
MTTDARGDCFAAAGRAILSGDSTTDMKLVHAFVKQPLLSSYSYPHGFNLVGDTVIDNSNGGCLKMGKEEYFDTFKIRQEEGVYAEYTACEALLKLTRSGNFGPWDLDEHNG